MNTAPKLTLQTRVTTAVVALVATFAVLHSLDALSGHYVKQQAAAQLASNSHGTSHHA